MQNVNLRSEEELAGGDISGDGGEHGGSRLSGPLLRIRSAVVLYDSRTELLWRWMARCGGAMVV